MTAKYYKGLAGMQEKREKTCTICVKGIPNDDFSVVKCDCKKSDHYGHLIAPDHPACDEYKQGKGKTCGGCSSYCEL